MTAIRRARGGSRMPAQQPGRSRQDYGTPFAFIDACKRRFGPLAVDLAARYDNAKAPRWIGPETDSLAASWEDAIGEHELAWLNPPFNKIGSWARKCALACTRRILMLVPASVGSEWYAAYVHERALVLALRPRLVFQGCTDPYPKDLILCAYGYQPRFDTWRWDNAYPATQAKEE